MLVRGDEPVAEPLMIPFGVIVGMPLTGDTAKREFADEDVPIEALGFHTSELPFEEGVQIG